MPEKINRHNRTISKLVYSFTVKLGMKKLKQRLAQGDTVLGCWLNLGSPVTAEIVGLAGFDWVLIDLEHGAGAEKDVLHQLQALEHTPAAAIVRIEGSQRQRIQRHVARLSRRPPLLDAREPGHCVLRRGVV